LRHELVTLFAAQASAKRSKITLRVEVQMTVEVLLVLDLLANEAH
jgi:hypothetical protein